MKTLSGLLNRVLSISLPFAMALAVPAPAEAITFGKADGFAHPNVGALVFVNNDGTRGGILCSGTLISPTVFLTAAHCVSWIADNASLGPANLGVFFDPVYDVNSLDGTVNPVARFSVPEGYGHDQGDPLDMAVVILANPVDDITPATLPSVGQLDDMKSKHELKGENVVTVGYGVLRDDKTRGPASIGWGDPRERQFANQGYLALTPAWLKLSMNPAKGNGGGCIWDSGGPHFLGDTDTVVALTVTGDTWCRATDVTYRLDTIAAHDFLSNPDFGLGLE